MTATAGRWIVGASALGAMLAAPGIALATPASIVRIEIQNASELGALYELGLDVLTERAGPGWVDVRVPSEAAPRRALTALRTEVVVADLDAAL